jgi:hypothetical protein
MLLNSVFLMRYDTLVNLKDMSADINSQVFFSSINRKKSVKKKGRILIFDEKFSYKGVTH